MTLGQTLFTVAMGAMALLGLAIASRAEGGPGGTIGYVMAAVGVALVFVMIHRSTGSRSS